MQASFQEPKEKQTSAPVLNITKDTNGFVIKSDTSKMGLRTILMQHDKVVAYASI